MEAGMSARILIGDRTTEFQISERNRTSHPAFFAAWNVGIVSVPQVKVATMVWFSHRQAIGPPWNKKMNPLVALQVAEHLAQQESEYP